MVWWGVVGGRLKREGTYVYLWLIHVGRNQHNIAKLRDVWVGARAKNRRKALRVD